MNKIVKSVIIGVGAWTVAETIFAMGKGYALGVVKGAERDINVNCEELVDSLRKSKMLGARFITFMADASDDYSSKRNEKEES